MAQKQTQTKRISAEIYNYDKVLERIFVVVKKELSKENAKLIFDYNKSMTRQSISKAARRRIVLIVLLPMPFDSTVY